MKQRRQLFDSIFGSVDLRKKPDIHALAVHTYILKESLQFLMCTRSGGGLVIEGRNKPSIQWWDSIHVFRKMLQLHLSQANTINTVYSSSSFLLFHNFKLANTTLFRCYLPSGGETLQMKSNNHFLLPSKIPRILNPHNEWKRWFPKRRS